MLAHLQHILTVSKYLTEKQFRYPRMSWKIYGFAGKEISRVFVSS